MAVCYAVAGWVEHVRHLVASLDLGSGREREGSFEEPSPPRSPLRANAKASSHFLAQEARAATTEVLSVHRHSAREPSPQSARCRPASSSLEAATTPRDPLHRFISSEEVEPLSARQAISTGELQTGPRISQNGEQESEAANALDQIASTAASLQLASAACSNVVIPYLQERSASKCSIQGGENRKSAPETTRSHGGASVKGPTPIHVRGQHQATHEQRNRATAAGETSASSQTRVVCAASLPSTNWDVADEPATLTSQIQSATPLIRPLPSSSWRAPKNGASILVDHADDDAQCEARGAASCSGGAGPQSASKDLVPALVGPGTEAFAGSLFGHLATDPLGSQTKTQRHPPSSEIGETCRVLRLDMSSQELPPPNSETLLQHLAVAGSAARTESPSHAPTYWLNRESEAALCFAAGHLDLVSAISLACVDRHLGSILSTWLWSLKWASLTPRDTVPRLWAASHAVLHLQRLSEIQIGRDRLDVRWLRSAAMSRNVLDLRGSLSRSTSLHGAFEMVAFACRLACRGSVTKVVLPTFSAELRGRALDVSKKAIGEEGGCHVAGVLAGAVLPELRDLHLSQCKLRDAAARALARTISSGTLACIRVVKLNDNRIGPRGAQAVADALLAHGAPQLPKLTVLDLNANLVGNQGVDSLARVLLEGGLPSLTELGLGRNNIDDISFFVHALAKVNALQLRRLHLHDNNLREGSLRELHDVITSAAPKSPGLRACSTSPEFSNAHTQHGVQGVAVRVRGVFKKHDSPPAQWMRAARRDAAVQT